jgi:hypothetical protein
LDAAINCLVARPGLHNHGFNTGELSRLESFSISALLDLLNEEYRQTIAWVSCWIRIDWIEKGDIQNWGEINIEAMKQ